MKNVLILVFVALLSISNLFAQNKKLENVGYAAFNLTAETFNCDGLTSATNRLSEIHLAFLYNTFGNNFSCLKRFIQNPKLKTLQIHLINEPGHRNNRLFPYEFLFDVGTPADYDRKIRSGDLSLKEKYFEYLLPLREFLQQNLRPGIELLISPGLESNLSPISGRILIQWTREIFPDVRIVWNSLMNDASRMMAVNADLIEAHGLFPNLKAPCIFNLDGADVSYSNRPALGEPQYKEGLSKNWLQNGAPVYQLFEEYANKCEVAFFWTAESNGLDYRKTSFIDPRKRVHAISSNVYRRIFSDIVNLHKNGLIYPSEYIYTSDDNYVVPFCTRILENFEDTKKSGNLLKQSEFRNRGAALILSNTFSSFRNVKLYKGRTIVDSYKYSGTYKDGRSLFRSNKSPITYPLNTYLVLEKNNSKICYKIANPRIRLD